MRSTDRVAAATRALGLAFAGLVAGAATAGGATPGDARPSGPVAVFWSQGRTWLVTPEPALRYAEGWYGPDGDGGVRRYRLRAEAKRPGEHSEPTSRWTRLWSVRVGDRAWAPVTSPPEAGAAGSAVNDEETVLQFRGDAATVGRFRREVDAEGRVTQVVTAATLDLPDGEARALPAGVAEALTWARARVPDLADPCLSRPIGHVALESPGGRTAEWLVLGAGEAACAGAARVVRLGGVAAPPVPFAGRTWSGRAVTGTGAAPVEDVVDLRVAPGGAHALLLVGEPLPEGGDLAALDAPCPDRRVLFWSAAADAPTPLGPGATFTGLRFLTDPEHPILALAETHFRRVDEPCTAPVAELTPAPVKRGEAGVLADGVPDEWPTLVPTGHACRVDETPRRAWAGPGDVSAAVLARRDGGHLAFVVRVRDDLAHDGDRVRLWIGARRPVRLEVAADGLVDKAPAGLEIGYAGTRDGYVVEGRAPLSLFGDPPALAVRVDDVDAPGEDAVRLWAGGHPVDRGHKPAALAPVEVP